MSDEFFRIVIITAVGLAGVAVLVEFLAAIALWRTANRIQQRVDRLAGAVAPLRGMVRTVIDKTVPVRRYAGSIPEHFGSLKRESKRAVEQFRSAARTMKPAIEQARSAAAAVKCIVLEARPHVAAAAKDVAEYLPDLHSGRLSETVSYSAT
jgi:hypothetical protein